MRRTAIRIPLLGAALFALAACNDGTAPNGEPQVGLGFQMATSSSASAAATSRSNNPDGRAFVGDAPVSTSTAEGLQITRDDDVILLTKAQFVIRDVKLRRDAVTCDDDDDSLSVSVAGFRVTHRDGDRCPLVRLGPLLVDMPVNGDDGGRVSVPVPEGTYTSVRLFLHKVTSNSPMDAEFRQTNPDFRGISIRLEGRYNDTPFVFVGDVTALIDVPLPDPVVIGAGGDDVTVLIDPSLWFLRPQGGLYAPALANTPGLVRFAVQHNIRVAFRAFRDRNRDGRAD